MLDYIKRKIQNLGEDDYRIYTAQMVKEYGLNYSHASDIISGRVDLEDTTLHERWVLLSIINPDKVKEYFTDTQVENLKKIKDKIDDNKIIKKIKCLKITDDQYIGKITLKEIVALWNGGIINYNPDTQRQLKIKRYNYTTGVIEEYELSINMKKVKEIVKSIKDNGFISTPITLNVTDDDYYYDEDTCELVFEDLTKVDIIDGFHRLIAMNQVWVENNDFDLCIEVRIVEFSKDKAQQFIYQEDQKTHLNKSDSMSLKQDDEANKMVKRLNSEPGFCFRGKINRNGGIDFAIFTDIVRKILFTEKLDKKDINNYIDNIKRVSNVLYENDKLQNIKMNEIVALIMTAKLSIDGYEIELYDCIYNAIKSNKYTLLTSINRAKKYVKENEDVKKYMKEGV